jgi:PncC family amidohydrolase
MEPIVKHIHSSLVKAKKTVAVAESCTGGLASSLLTYIGGSSRFYILGLICYSNRAKERLLNIPAKLLAAKGAVCAEVAKRMAQNVRELAKTDFGIGITGIAGPGGATAGKPLGTVYIALSSRKKTTCKKFRFSGRRQRVRRNASRKALELLYSAL